MARCTDWVWKSRRNGYWGVDGGRRVWQRADRYRKRCGLSATHGTRCRHHCDGISNGCRQKGCQPMPRMGEATGHNRCPRCWRGWHLCKCRPGTEKIPDTIGADGLPVACRYGCDPRAAARFLCDRCRDAYTAEGA